jgi:hypothetical protein
MIYSSEFLYKKCENCYVEIFGDLKSKKEMMLISIALEKRQWAK